MQAAMDAFDVRWPDGRPDATAVIELRSVGRTFGADPPVVALREVNLLLTHGTSLAIVGPSGSGK